jgi:hypothetical protein
VTFDKKNARQGGAVRSGFINVAGIDLEFAEQGSGEPLLMLHGAGGSIAHILSMRCLCFLRRRRPNTAKKRSRLE